MRRSRDMWGRGAGDERGPTSRLRRRPPQEPSETKRLPDAEGPPEGNETRATPFLSAGAFISKLPFKKKPFFAFIKALSLFST